MRFFSRFLRWFFKHLYTTLAWSYDFVAWTVSIGQWGSWQAVGLEPLPQGDILEIGHGPGHLLRSLSDTGRQAIGVDVSPQMVRLAARRLRRSGRKPNVARALAQSLPFPSRSFDAVLTTFPSEYILDGASSSEAWRVLRSGGMFVIVPLAEVLGASVPDRFGAWLFRVTGQAGQPDPAWIKPLEALGFLARIERITQKRAIVWRIVAEKPGPSASQEPFDVGRRALPSRGELDRADCEGRRL